MSNQVRTLKLNDRLQLPETTTRSTAKFLIADLYGSDASAFALADTTAARDSFVARCAALALASMVYGDASRLERMKKYASTLPNYRTDKAGLPTGKLGKLLTAYGEAVNIGRALASQIDAAADEVNLSMLSSSPVFGALIAPPQAKPKPSAPSAGVTASVPTAATKAEADDDDDAIKEAAEKAAKIEKERYEARGRAASYRVWNDAVAKQRADSDARKEAAEAEAKRQAWLAAKAQEKARDAAKDHAIAAMEFIALAEMIGIKLTPAQVKKAQAYAAEQQEKLAA